MREQLACRSRLELPDVEFKASPLCDALPQPADKAAEDGYLQLGSVCQLLIVGNYGFAHDYGCMHPGMPPGRIHFRRSRDAPIQDGGQILAGFQRKSHCALETS